MANPFVVMEKRIAELERRQGNYIRKVTVTENEGGKVKVEDGSGFKSGLVPQAAITSGEWRFDAPANEGAQGYLISPDGDPAQGMFFPCLPSNENPNASTELGTLRLRGPNNIALTIKDGVVTIEANSIELGGSGGPRVARIGDRVEVKTGSSAGLWKIVEGSEVVTAT